MEDASRYCETRSEYILAYHIEIVEVTARIRNVTEKILSYNVRIDIIVSTAFYIKI